MLEWTLYIYFYIGIFSLYKIIIFSDILYFKLKYTFGLNGKKYSIDFDVNIDKNSVFF